MRSRFSRPSFCFGLLSLCLLSTATVLSWLAPVVNSAPGSAATAPVAPPDNVYRIPIDVNEIIYNPLDQMIYASRPSRAGSDGNSITRINPVTGQIGPSVYVGSEPNKLALSDNGQSLYISIDGAYSIRRYNTLTQTPGLQFSSGRRQYSDATNAVIEVSDLAVAPGNADVLAVAAADRMVTIFSNGAELPQRSNGSDFLAFSDASTLFGGGGSQSEFKKYAVSGSGVTDVTGQGSSFSATKLKYENNLIFDSLGHVINATTRTLVGTCVGVTPVPSGILNTFSFVPDTANGRILYAVKNNQTIVIKAFDLNTFLMIGSFSIPVGSETFPQTLVRYGTNGLAMRTSDNQLYLIQTSLIPTGNPLPTPAGTPPTPTPAPTPYSKFVRQINLENRDLLFRQADQKFYASIPGAGGVQYGNSLTRIEPSTATLETSVVVGSEPGRLAFSDDEQTLYVGLDGVNAIRRFDMATQTPGLQFSLGTSSNGPLRAFDIDVLRGDANAVAVGYSDQYFGAEVYDNGVKRAQRAHFSGPVTIASQDRLFVGDSYLGQYGIDAAGLTRQANMVLGGAGDPVLVGNLLYSAAGLVLDVNTQNFLGRFMDVQYLAGLAVDVPNNRIFFLSNDTGGAPPGSTLRAFRLDNYQPIGTVALPGVFISNQYGNGPRRLIRWGANGLAFTDHSNRIFFLQSDLVSSSGTVPSVIQLGAQTFEVNEGDASLPVTVLRTGGLTGTSTINYTTVNGTATAGTDYTATAGTLSFGPGEASKTINIPIISDNVYEGVVNESLSFVLSNPGGDGTVELREPSTAALTIIENDPSPVANAANITVNEPQVIGTTADAVFTVQLTNPTSVTVTLNYNTFNQTAIAGLDYTATSGTLTFAPLESSKTVTVKVLADELFNETNEQFRLELSNGVNTGIGFPPGVATIVNYNPNPPTPTPTATPTPTPPASPSPTPTPSASPTPTTSPTPTPSPTPTATPAPTPVFLRRVSLPLNDFVYRATENAIYASVPSAGGIARGNSVTKIDPVNGQLGDSVFIGSEPNKMIVSDDGSTIYVRLDGSKAIRRFDASTLTAGAQFVPQSPFVFFEDWAVQPGNPQVIAISNFEGVAIYDNGVQRPLVSDGGAYSINSISFASPTTLYGYDNYSSGFELVNFTVTPSGVTGVHMANELISGFSVDIEYSSGLIYATSGRVVNPATLSVAGTFTGGVGQMAVDQAGGRVFFLNGNSLSAYNINTYAKIGAVTIPGLTEATGRLVRWGDNGLAVRGTNQLYLIQSSLVSASGTVPTGLALSAQNYNRSENGGNLTVTVNRTGTLTGTSTINYATADGTATAGTDYTATSGTLTFSPGQTAKTVNIPITNDNVFEGTESFSLVLSGPGGDGTVELQDPATATLTINDNDSAPSTSALNVNVNEPRIAGTRTALFTVRLSNPTTQTASVDFATSNLTATAGSDYTAASGTVTFGPLETTKTVAVEILADQLYNEPNETFRINFSNAVNSFISVPQATGTIINYNPQTAVHAGFDYDADGRADISVFRPESGAWYLTQSQAGYFGIQFGISTDRIAPADYDGDGKTDIAVYRPSDGVWFILNSASGVVEYRIFGLPEDLPAPADYDGDGKADICIFRPSSGTWYLQRSSDGTFYGIQFGLSGDQPTVGDFDGDNKADIGIWRPSNGDWYHIRSSDGTIFGERFGISTDKMVPADYDGDHKTDIAVWRPADGIWYIKQSSNGAYVSYLFGLPADVPAPADFDGDGKADRAVFRPSDGTWYITNTTNGSFTIFPWGQSGDIPTPAAFGN